MKRFKKAIQKKPMFQAIIPANTMVNIGDSSVFIEGHSQSLRWKNMMSAFPEQIECEFTLKLNAVHSSLDLTILSQDEESNENRTIEDVYTVQKAYEAIEWSDPKSIRWMIKGILYPKDLSWSLQLLSKNIAFATLGQVDRTVQENTVCSYGGVLPEEGGTLDSIYQLQGVFTIDSDQIKENARGESFGMHVRNGCMIMALSSPYMQNISNYRAYQNFGIQPLEDAPIEQMYASYDYFMLDSETMRVRFFPKDPEVTLIPE
jgi:hypothetical protein